MQALLFVVVSEKWSLRCVVGPRSIQMEYLWMFSVPRGGAEKTKTEKPKRRQECAGRSRLYDVQNSVFERSVERECPGEPFMRSILCHEGYSHLPPVLAYIFFSRCKFSTIFVPRLYSQNPGFENVHEESVKVYAIYGKSEGLSIYT